MQGALSTRRSALPLLPSTNCMEAAKAVAAGHTEKAATATSVYLSPFPFSLFDMASTSSKSLPFIVLAILLGLGIYEAETNKNVPLEPMIPVLVAIGVGGVPLAAVKSIAANKAAVKQAVKDYKESGASST